jgi:hypothetical protein
MNNSNAMKNLDDLKTEFKSFKFKDEHMIGKHMKETGEEHDVLRSIIASVKDQDRIDERYILYRKILPVALGIVFLTLLVAFYNINNKLILSGFVMVYIGLLSILILFLRDYRNISNETFDQTLLDYLEAKRKRLTTWKRIPVLYHLIYGCYIVGVLLIIMGNTRMAGLLGTSFGNLIFTGSILSALIISGLTGEYRFRKRHQQLHKPILERIGVLITELRTNGDIT